MRTTSLRESGLRKKGSAAGVAPSSEGAFSGGPADHTREKERKNRLPSAAGDPASLRTLLLAPGRLNCGLGHKRRVEPTPMLEGNSGKIRIGTCGWSYADWSGVFYPNELPAAEYLSFY